MYLTNEQEKMLKGEMGEGVKLAMEVVARIGDTYNADKMVRISCSHIMSHYGSLHQAGIDMMEKFASLGSAFRIPTTIDPISIDPEKWMEFKVPPEYAEKQMRLIEAVRKMGGIPTWSCVPYQCSNFIRYGECIACAESSVVSFANSVIGARTNRVSPGFDISCAITGLTPRFGLLLTENRHGETLINIEKEEMTDLDFHTVGYIIGKMVGNKIPVINGLPTNATTDQLKGLASAAASSGSVALFHAIGITPHAKNVEQAFGGEKPRETMTIEERDISNTESEITTSTEKPHLIAIGCPHYSVSEIREVAHKLDGKKIRKDVEFWIYTSKSFAEMAERMGLLQLIENCGAKITTSTCAVISPIRTWGFDVMMTNSAKFANVVPSEHKIGVQYASLDKIVKYATEGDSS
jgi:predicted aconitase